MNDDNRACTPVPASRREQFAAWVLRSIIVATFVGHVATGEVAYALLCAVALLAVGLPPFLAKSGGANVPVELEFFLFWVLIADMTLGRLGGLYDTSLWFDKALHLGNSVLLGTVAFLFVYGLHMTGRLQASSLTRGTVIFVVTLGLGAGWEIIEYVADLMFARGAQGSPLHSALDDTMIDLMLDGAGGVFGALLGPLYIARSARSEWRVAAFASFVPRE